MGLSDFYVEVPAQGRTAEQSTGNRKKDLILRHLIQVQLYILIVQTELTGYENNFEQKTGELVLHRENSAKN